MAAANPPRCRRNFYYGPPPIGRPFKKTAESLARDPGASQLALALLMVPASRSRPETMNRFDFRNAIVPFSLLDLRQHFKQMRPGDSLEVLWSDPSAADDLLRVLPAACIEIASKGELPGPSGGFRMELIKTSMEPPPTLGGILCHK